MAVAIKVENISKAYRLGEIGTGSLSNDLHRWWTKVRGKEDPYLKLAETNDRSTKGSSDVVWSLKDINFEIQQGDAVGIIGRNGAGKSTLLKLLSRVTSPTTGVISGEGRVASLLEVGTGFHPELTGRENIFLNGAILGMRKKEIKKKFDEIVDFSGVERYIDTPVKRYSSGMYVRLAFAVAAHLESEILIVDEVLAVGDSEFQKKCLGKMNEVSKGEGRTVLFVSHQMGSISQLCSRCLLLQHGKLIYNSSTEKTIQYYLSTNSATNHFALAEKDRNGLYHIAKMELKDKEGKLRKEFSTDESLCLHIHVESKKFDPKVELALALIDKRGYRVFTVHEPLFPKLIARDEEEKTIKISFPSKFLAPAIGYSWIATIHIPHQHSFHLVENVCSFSILDAGTNLASYEGSDIGVVLPQYSIVN